MSFQCNPVVRATVAAGVLLAASAGAAPPPPGPLGQWSRQYLPAGWSLQAQDWLRYEQWSHFDPAGTTGDPDYGYAFNRFRLGLHAEGSQWFADGALQVVNQVSLPDDATGVPGGPLGLGAVYYNHNRDTDPASVYVRTLRLGLRNLFGTGVELAAGRMDYNSGMESVSGNATVDALKDMRIDSRVIGPFDWSAYQRSFDGVALKRALGPGQFNFAALHPTQGGFEHDAYADIGNIDLFTFVYTATLSLAGGTAELQGFSYLFEDTRRIAVRPDNTGQPVSRQDLDIVNVGGHLVAAWESDAGTTDLLLWGIHQGGDWFDQDQDAYAIALEAGYHWKRVPGRPWLRAGIDLGSGDKDPLDGEHQTFYQMLPTVRKYSYTTLYNLMNNTDVFVQVLAQPVEALRLRLDYHVLWLTERTDLWWQGAGATQSHGTIQGYSGRPSGGDRQLGQSIEATAQYQFTPVLGLQLFYGHVEGGAVVENLFTQDDDFDLFFAELNLRF